MKNEWQVGAMASRPVENLVLLTVSTCGRGGAELGSDEKEICSLTWQVIDTAKIQVGTKWGHAPHGISPTFSQEQFVVCSFTLVPCSPALLQPASSIEHVYVCPEELPQDGLTPVGIDVAKFSQAPSLSERLKQVNCLFHCTWFGFECTCKLTDLDSLFLVLDSYNMSFQTSQPTAIA